MLVVLSAANVAELQEHNVFGQFGIEDIGDVRRRNADDSLPLVVERPVRKSSRLSERLKDFEQDERSSRGRNDTTLAKHDEKHDELAPYLAIDQPPAATFEPIEPMPSVLPTASRAPIVDANDVDTQVADPAPMTTTNDVPIATPQPIANSTPAAIFKRPMAKPKKISPLPKRRRSRHIPTPTTVDDQPKPQTSLTPAGGKRRGRPPKKKSPVNALQPTTRYNAKFVDPYVVVRSAPPQPTTSKRSQLQLNSANQSANVHIADDDHNRLVSFSYRRHRQSQAGTTTKEVNVQFCDDDSGDSSSFHRPPPATMATTTVPKPTTNERSRSNPNRQCHDDVPPSSESESEEILPVSRRMAEKRRSEAAAAAARSKPDADVVGMSANFCAADMLRTPPMADLCRGRESHDYTLASAVRVATPKPMSLSPVLDVSSRRESRRQRLTTEAIGEQCELTAAAAAIAAPDLSGVLPPAARDPSLPIEPIPSPLLVESSTQQQQTQTQQAGCRIVTMRSDCSQMSTVFSPPANDRSARGTTTRLWNPPASAADRSHRNETRRTARSMDVIEVEATAAARHQPQPTTTPQPLGRRTVANLSVYHNNWLLRQFIDQPASGRRMTDGRPPPQSAIGNGMDGIAAGLAAAASSFAVHARADSGDALLWVSSNVETPVLAVDEMAHDDGGDGAPAAAANAEPAPKRRRFSTTATAVIIQRRSSGVIDCSQHSVVVTTTCNAVTTTATAAPPPPSMQQAPANHDDGPHRSSAALRRLDDPALQPGVSLAHMTAQCGAAVERLMRESAASVERQLAQRLDAYQQSMDRALSAHSHSMQQTKLRLGRSDGRLRELELELAAERETFRTCMEQAEVE